MMGRQTRLPDSFLDSHPDKPPHTETLKLSTFLCKCFYPGRHYFTHHDALLEGNTFLQSSRSDQNPLLFFSVKFEEHVSSLLKVSFKCVRFQGLRGKEGQRHPQNSVPALNIWQLRFQTIWQGATLQKEKSNPLVFFLLTKERHLSFQWNSGITFPKTQKSPGSSGNPKPESSIYFLDASVPRILLQTRLFRS